MIFVLITFLTAFLIEGLGTIVSVIGLSTLFGANPIIISLAVALDMGKLVVVSLLYKHWKQMGVLMKGYALIAALVTMIITSAGAAGYLTGEFQKAIMGTQETSLKVNVLKEQQAKFEARKKQIDDQIANLPSNYSKSRITLMKQFEAEQKELQSKIDNIDKQLPDLQLKQIGVEAKAGPILYISKAFEVPIEVAVKYVVLLIIFVFDPLAVFLIIAGNFLMEHRKKKPEPPPGPGSGGDGPKEPEDPHPSLDGPGEYTPNAETLAAMAEAEEKIQARRAAQEAREEQIAVQQKIADENSFIPGTATPNAFAEGFEDHARQLGVEVEPEPAPDEPIIEAEPIQPATPEEPELTSEEEPEPLVVPSPRASEPRKEIRLEDLKPTHRSSLHDVRGDATVVFDQDPRDSTHGDFYSSRF